MKARRDMIPMVEEKKVSIQYLMSSRFRLEVRIKLCQAEKPSSIRDCDGIPLVGQGAVGRIPSCMI